MTVSASGAYLVNGRELINSSADTLRAAILKSTAGAARGAPVTIRADGRASHQAVVTAMDVLGRLGFTQMNVATLNETGAGPLESTLRRARFASAPAASRCAACIAGCCATPALRRHVSARRARHDACTPAPTC